MLLKWQLTGWRVDTQGSRNTVWRPACWPWHTGLCLLHMLLLMPGRHFSLSILLFQLEKDIPVFDISSAQGPGSWHRSFDCCDPRVGL